MFDHLTIRVRDLEASRRFYELALGPPRSGGGGFVEWGDFGIAEAAPGKPATRNLHVGFAAPDRAHVEEWWERLTQAGHPDDGRPGVRPEYKPSYYGAFVIDPDGNSAESVHHDETPFGRAVIDHLWLRSDHLDAAERFYSLVAPLVGHRIVRDSDPDSVRVTDGTGSFSFVGDGGEQTENVHLAFSVSDRFAVDEFHRRTTAAGYRDNGRPGERPEYHAGYHGAFVLDPDGHNVEAVFHDRSRVSE